MKKEKTLTLMDMIGMTLSAFVSMELISSMAGIGPSVIAAFIIFGGTYVFTHCVICAELGSTYPDQGGIYSWVKRGLGDKWAARTNWWYWLNVVGFIPSVMIPTIAIFKQLFWPEMSLTVTIILCIVGIWLIVFFNTLPLKDSKLLNNVGTAAKIIFCIALIGGGIYIAFTGRSRVAFSAETMVPEFNLALIALIPVFVYGLTGMDVVGCAAEEMHDPKKDMPKALVISTVIAMALYIFSTMAVEIILPADQIDGTTGLIDAIMIAYNGSKVVICLIGVALALLYFSNAFSWPLAANKAAQEAAEEGEFPEIFAKTNQYGSPVGGAVILGIAATCLIGFYGLIATTNEGLFWTLLAFTGIVFFAPYITMSFAFLKLRMRDKDMERTFQIPGKKFPYLCGVYHIIILVGSCISFLIPPDGERFTYTLVLLATLIGTQIIGEVIVNQAMKRKNK